MITTVVHCDYGVVHRFPDCLAVEENGSLRIMDSLPERIRDRARFVSGSWTWYEHVTTPDEEKTDDTTS